MVGGIVPIMAETDAPGAIDDERTGKLANIAFGYTHPLSFGHGCHPLDCQAWRQQPDKRGPLKLERRKKAFLWIGNHRKRDIKTLLESCRFLTIAESDEHHPGTQTVKRFFVAAQLRHLIPAERSPVMSQKDQHQRSLRPEAAQAGGCFVP
jgi:hypothetical protein